MLVAQKRDPRDALPLFRRLVEASGGDAISPAAFVELASEQGLDKPAPGAPPAAAATAADDDDAFGPVRTEWGKKQSYVTKQLSSLHAHVRDTRGREPSAAILKLAQNHLDNLARLLRLGGGPNPARNAAMALSALLSTLRRATLAVELEAGCERASEPRSGEKSQLPHAPGAGFRPGRRAALLNESPMGDS